MFRKNRKPSLYTEVSLGECAKRLDCSIEKEHFLFSPSSGQAQPKQITGKLKGTKFHLYKKRYFSAPCAPVFYGQFIKQNNGTTIEGRFGIHPVAKTMWRVWAIGIILLASNVYNIVILNKLTGKSFEQRGAVFVLIGIAVMIVFAVMLFIIYKRRRKDDENYIINFFQKTFGTREFI